MVEDVTTVQFHRSGATHGHCVCSKILGQSCIQVLDLVEAAVAMQLAVAVYIQPTNRPN